MIIAVYHNNPPGFPPTDQNPNALRIKIGPRWVDYVGAQPVQADIDAHIAPIAVDARLATSTATGLAGILQEIADLKAFLKERVK